MLKVALVGVGGISGVHIPAWKDFEDTELVAICDIRTERTEQYPEIKSYTDFDEMLENEEIDILDICLPTYLHADFAIKAMNKGINVVSEKPISLKKEDVERVYSAADKNGVKFMVAQVLRFFPEYDFLKKVYDSKKYGKLLCGSMRRLENRPVWSWDGWMFDENRSGLVPFDLHIHDLDWLVYTFGKPNKYSTNRASGSDCDYINVVYEYDGFFVTAEAAWYAANEYPFNAGFTFQFEDALIVSGGGKLTVYEKDGKAIDMTPGADSKEESEIGLPATNGYADELRYFTDCVKAGKKAEKVKPAELETVIEILKDIH